MLLGIIDEGYLDTTDVIVEVPDSYARNIREQLGRIDTQEERRRFTEALLRHLARVMCDFLDGDLRPPTEKQVRFAFSLARQRQIEVPRDALIYRAAMEEFLDNLLGPTKN